jgi:hypothetical protein
VPSFWTKENNFGINVSEVAFVNWNAGGDNAVSALSFLKFKRNYKFRYFKWDNNLDLRYGVNAQEGQKIRKNGRCSPLQLQFGIPQRYYQ